MGKPGGKGQLRRPKSRWEDNIKIDLQEVEWRGMDWIYLDQDRDRTLVNTEIKLRFP